MIGPEELAAELREEDPESMSPVQQALLSNIALQFYHLYAGPLFPWVIQGHVIHEAPYFLPDYLFQ